MAVVSSPANAIRAVGWRHRTGAAVREIWRDKPAALGLAVLAVIVACALFAPWIAPHDPTAQSLSDRLLPPVWADGGEWSHPLGTDGLGADVLSRIIHGARVSLLVGVAVVAFAGTLGIAAGLVSGFFGGRTDRIVMRIVDTQVAFPGLLLALLLLAVIGASVTTVIIVLGINGWMVYARTTRGIVLGLRGAPHVEAARVAGCRPKRIIVRHILPNLASPLLTLAVLEFARIVLAEAALSYLGLGVQFPDTSWGLDVAKGQDLIFSAWWLVTFPGAAIAVTVLAANLVASWLRIIADPYERDKRFAAGSGVS